MILLLFFEKHVLSPSFILDEVRSAKSFSKKYFDVHNALPSRLKDKLMCGSFHWYILWLNPQKKLSFTSPLYKKIGIIVESRYDHSVKTWKAWQKSNFESKFLQVVRFWTENFSCGQIMNRDFHNASSFFASRRF